jgi:hypothetical protein
MESLRFFNKRIEPALLNRVTISSPQHISSHSKMMESTVIHIDSIDDNDDCVGQRDSHVYEDEASCPMQIENEQVAHSEQQSSNEAMMIMEPIRLFARNNAESQPPPKRFYRTIWRGIARRMFARNTEK